MDTEKFSYSTDIDYEKLDAIGDDFDELVRYIKSNFYEEDAKYRYPLEVRAKILRAIYKNQGIYPSNEQFVFILSTVHRLLCEACAGSGKTTMVIGRALDQNICNGVSGKDILMIAFNTHAVEDMRLKYTRMAKAVNMTNQSRIHADTNIQCHTFHSWCKMWVMEYVDRFEMNSKSFMGESQAKILMSIVVAGYVKGLNRDVYISDAVIDNFMSLYNYSRETLTESDPSSWKTSSAYTDLKDFKNAEIISIMGKYEYMKKLKKRMDFSDMINNMYELLKDPEIMARVRSNYKVFIFDEYQDEAQAMVRIIKLLLEGDESLGIARYDNAYLTCIGDGDQSIYGFRGTDPDNCLRFRSTFDYNKIKSEDVRVVSLSVNRRCCSNILDKARDIIESNTERINKPIRALKPGGDVFVHQYYSVNGELDLLCETIRNYTLQDMLDTCICYRNTSSSCQLVMTLLEYGIPFNLHRGSEPFGDLFTKALDGILDLFINPDNPAVMSENLYKAIPKSAKYKKETLSKRFENMKNLRFSKNGMNEERKKFFELDWSGWDNINGFSEAMNVLRRSYLLYRQNQPMSAYMPEVVELVRKYYVDWMNKDRLTNEYIAKVTKWYTRSIQFRDFDRERRQQKKFMEDSGSAGVYLTTFHGLKGLEFKRVFVIDLQEDIFPGSELTRATGLNAEQIAKIELEARRLLYVVCTRAKEELTLFFSKNMPSRYIKFFVEDPALLKAYETLRAESESEESGYVFASSDGTDRNPGDITDIFEGMADIGEELFKDFEEVPQTEYTESAIEESDRMLEKELGKNVKRLDSKPGTKDTLRLILERRKIDEI